LRRQSRPVFYAAAPRGLLFLVRAQVYLLE
jgi:hypothetical protein